MLTISIHIVQQSPCLQILKTKAIPIHARNVFGERRYSSYSFSTSALDGVELSASRPGRGLAPGKGSQEPIVQEAGWASEPVWAQRPEEKSFRHCRGSNLERPVVQPVVALYRLSYPAHVYRFYQNKIFWLALALFLHILHYFMFILDAVSSVLDPPVVPDTLLGLFLYVNACHSRF
jgi:hypothetical protein